MVIWGSRPSCKPFVIHVVMAGCSWPGFCQRKRKESLERYTCSLRSPSLEVAHSASTYVPLLRDQSHGHRLLQGSLGKAV